MTEYVLLSDIHANYPALEAVVEREGANAKYLVLGDILGLNGFPEETVSLLESLDATTILGNHEAAIVQHDEGHVVNDALSRFEYEHTVDGLTKEQHKWLETLSHLEVMQSDDSRICLAHAYPLPEQASGYESGNAGVAKGDVTHVASVVSNDYDWVFHGHTHTQYDIDCSKFGHDVHFVNPGSLGYASTYSTVDVDSGEVKHKSVEYDHQRVVEHVERLLPDDAPSAQSWL